MASRVGDHGIDVILTSWGVVAPEPGERISAIPRCHFHESGRESAPATACWWERGASATPWRGAGAL